MTGTIILHHYENSPYAEKIRLMFGFTGSHWRSLLSPAWPPRPNIDPLSGGYRRIPIAQIGADIFCDSSLIAREIAAMSGHPSLDPAKVRGTALELMRSAEGEGFFAAITALPPYKLFGTMLSSFGPLGTVRFMQDRGKLLKGGNATAPQGGRARDILRTLLGDLEAHLSRQPWVAGEAPCAADFAVYHPLWLHLRCGGRLPPSAKNTRDWYARVAEFGHGERREIDQDEAFEEARNANPRTVRLTPGEEPADKATSDSPGDAIAPGTMVEVSPQDYGVVPVAGRLAAATADRIILARESDDFGALHVHFPRRGYLLRKVTA